jgi:formylglycine-generating enzyme
LKCSVLRLTEMRIRLVPIIVAAALLSAGAATADGVAAPAAAVSGGEFESVLPIAPGQNRVRVKTFRMDATPVTNSEFAAFVRSNPKWRRDRAVGLFADNKYLSHWPSHTTPDPKQARQPVTQVSWYAARAYCEARGARLPTWYEWEWAAAASETQADARQDPEWKQQILAWYSRPATDGLPNVGAHTPNIYGVHDLHGLVWEWVEDYNGMLVSGDNRQQSEPDATRFCGPGALTMEQKEHYAILMRIAMLSSMQANYTTETIGFRCVQ